jgi:putative transposase
MRVSNGVKGVNTLQRGRDLACAENVIRAGERHDTRRRQVRGFDGFVALVQHGNGHGMVVAVLLGLAYLTVTNTFAVLRLLPASDRDKDTEILVLRHQIAVLERQLGGKKVRFTPPDRALLAALLHRWRPETLRRMRLLVRPDPVLRWHRDLIRKRHAARSKPKRPGRPPTVRSIRVLVLRLVRENPAWGYRRVHGELLMLGLKVAPSTVWEILKDAGIDPAPERSATTWADFLRSQAAALLACDFLETVNLTGTRMFVLAVIEHHTRRIRVLGATAHPCASWVTQAARNLVMDLAGPSTNTNMPPELHG